MGVVLAGILLGDVHWQGWRGAAVGFLNLFSPESAPQVERIYHLRVWLLMKGEI